VRAHESWWLREYAIEPPPQGALSLNDLRALRPSIEDMLRLPLFFFVKMKFQMEFLLPDPFGEDAVQGRPQRNEQYYLLQPAPWSVEPLADAGARMEAIVQHARDALDAHLEAARFRGSGESIGAIKRIYVLVGPAGELERLPAPGVGDPPAGARVQLKPLPESLAKKQGLWNPQNEGHDCFAWCVRAHMAGIDAWDGAERKHSVRLRDPRFFEAGYAAAMRQRRGRDGTARHSSGASSAHQRCGSDAAGTAPRANSSGASSAHQRRGSDAAGTAPRANSSGAAR
jgi:hypothetical protein